MSPPDPRWAWKAFFENEEGVLCWFLRDNTQLVIRASLRERLMSYHHELPLAALPGARRVVYYHSACVNGERVQRALVCALGLGITCPKPACDVRSRPFTTDHGLITRFSARVTHKVAHQRLTFNVVYHALDHNSRSACYLRIASCRYCTTTSRIPRSAAELGTSAWFQRHLFAPDPNLPLVDGAAGPSADSRELQRLSSWFYQAIATSSENSRSATPSKRVPSTAMESAVTSAAAAKGTYPNPHRRHAWPTEMDSTHPCGVAGAAREPLNEGEGESLVQRPRT